MKPKTIIISLFIIFISNIGYSQTSKNAKGYRYPVLVKMFEGSGNVFRLGFLRYNDFFEVKEDISSPQANISRFLVDYDLKDKMFVHFPTSDKSGETLIVPKACVTKLDLTYEQAIDIIYPK